MRPNTVKRRREKALDDTVDAIQARISIRQAAQANHVPKSTVFDRLQARRTKRQRRYRTAFTAIEEDNLVEFVVSWADKGVPLTRRHLVEATSMFISTMSTERRCHLPFKNDVPGPRLVRSFYSRHRDALKPALPYFQEDKRCEAFFRWAQKLTASIRHIVGGALKVLLTYDGYRSHMTLKVLEHLRAHGVVV